MSKKTAAKKNSATIPYEQFAVALLLATPSTLSKRWRSTFTGEVTKAKRDKLLALVADLGVSKGFQPRFVDLLTRLGETKDGVKLLKEVSKLFALVYDPPACPATLQSRNIIKALQVLDHLEKGSK